MQCICQYFNQFYRGPKEPGFETMNFFLKEYHHFEKELKFIHIAGTNGKGSCAEIISNILEKQGYRVGKFISPHLERYNERISINHKTISNQDLESLIIELRAKIKLYEETDDRKVTFFELITIIALLYFYRKKVDFVVLETGLGGLFDCTNIIEHPLVSIITSIGYDHMAILGSSLPEIAYQKAGIIKKESNTVFWKQEEVVNKIIKQKCELEHNKLHLLEENMIRNYVYHTQSQVFDFQSLQQLELNLKGRNQVKNACLCVEAIQILNSFGYDISENNIREGLKTVIHKGRMEQIRKKPVIIYDGAHNTPAILNLKENLAIYYPSKKRCYVIGVLQKKDYKSMIKILLQDQNADFIFTSGNSEGKFVPMEELYEEAKKYQTGNQKCDKMGLKEAFAKIKENDSNVITIITGSFYLYHDAMEFFKEMK